MVATKTKTRQVETPVSAQTAKASNIMVDLGIADVVEVEHLGYIPHFADVKLTEPGRKAMKQLAVTLDQRGARLSDGTLVKSSVPKTIAWLCERVAESI